MKSGKEMQYKCLLCPSFETGGKRTWLTGRSAPCQVFYKQYNPVLVNQNYFWFLHAKVGAFSLALSDWQLRNLLLLLMVSSDTCLGISFSNSVLPASAQSYSALHHLDPEYCCSLWSGAQHKFQFCFLPAGQHFSAEPWRTPYGQLQHFVQCPN